MKEYTSETSYFTGVLTAITGALTLNEWLAVVGIICTLGTFLVNWYYKRKELLLRYGDKT